MPRFRRTKFNSHPTTKKKSPKNKTKLIGNNGGGNNGSGNRKLTPLRKRFTEEYLVDLNATQAVIRAGYSKNGAKEQGSYLLTLNNIQEAIQKRRLELTNKIQIDQEGVIRRYLMLTDYCVDDFFYDDGTMKVLSEIPKEKLYAICGLKHSKKTITTKDQQIIENIIKEFKLPDKKGVLDSLGKHLGMFAEDNKQKAGRVAIQGRNIQVNLVKRD